jgi:signal transduction histidine kinase
MGLCSIEEMNLEEDKTQLSITRIDDLLEGLSQVAHDIKSPLAALETVLSNTNNMDEEKRLLIKNSILRIKSISQDVLQKNRRIFELKEEKSRCLINQLVLELVHEKLHELYANKSIVINVNNYLPEGDLEVSLQRSRFKRTVSNLLNNAVESLGEGGYVEVDLSMNKKSDLVLVVTDNGKGIPAHVLPSLGKKGFTYGKKEGNGLGLYAAKKCISEHNGLFKLSSKAGNGTKIVMTLPVE